MAKLEYSVKVFVPHGGTETKWFAARLERAMWLIQHGYKPSQVLGFSDPPGDERADVFSV